MPDESTSGVHEHVHAESEPGVIVGGAVHDADSPGRGLALGTRWLGVGLASCVAVVTLVLAATGQIGLYINPEAAWWAVAMAIVVLVGAIASCAVPVTGHAHGHPAEGPDAHGASDHVGGTVDELPRRSPAAIALTVVGGAIASVIAVAAVVLPPASLSAELALARSSGVLPQLASSATLALASTGDTSEFGIGEWSAVIATTTDPTGFVGDEATLTGFVGPGEDPDVFSLTRLVIVHCVIDAQAASVPVVEAGWSDEFEVGQWVDVTGTFEQDGSGSLVFRPTTVAPTSEPGDPYEY